MGSVIVLDFLRMQEVRNLTHNVEYTDKTVDSNVEGNAEKLLKGQSISAVAIDDRNLCLKLK